MCIEGISGTCLIFSRYLWKMSILFLTTPTSAFPHARETLCATEVARQLGQIEVALTYAQFEGIVLFMHLTWL